jgi:hypothetical protein
MRARLAVLIAAAVVFAPGWGADRVAGSDRGSDEVGARMLAPTFDEASDRNAGSAQKRLERFTPRTDSHKLLPWLPGNDFPTAPLGLVLAAALAISSFRSFENDRPPTGRAPPYLLTA